MSEILERIIELARTDKYELTPLTLDVLQEVQREFPNLSDQYYSLARNLGWIYDLNGLSVTHRPFPLLQDGKSVIPTDFELYKKELKSRTFGRAKPHTIMPDELFVISQSGAGWDYCLRNDKSDIVYVFDYTSFEITPSYPSLFEYIEETLSPTSK